MKLQEKYKKEIAPALKEKFGYKNIFEIPKVQKVVLNVGFGRHAKEKAYIEAVATSLERISGQKPIMTKAKKSISSFKIREGMTIGACVTLRGARMNDFLEKLINVTFPRVRDFRGITAKGIDRTGNLTIGFKDNLAFPEVKTGEMENIFGLEICMPTNAKTYEEGYELFKLMGFPFKKDEK